MSTNKIGEPDVQGQLGRMVAILAKLQALEKRPNLRDKVRMHLELVQLADELGASMSSATRETLIRGAECV